MHSLCLAFELCSSEYIVAGYLSHWKRLLSVTKPCLTLGDSMDCSMPGFLVFHYPPEFAQTHVYWVSDAIQPSHPLSSPSPAFNLSHIRVFSNESVLRIRWPKYWSFGFSISPSNEYSGLISFRIDWFELAVQGTLKSLLQYTVQKHQFFSAQPSLWSNLHIHTRLLEKPELWLYGPFSAKWCLCFLICYLGWS